MIGGFGGMLKQVVNRKQPIGSFVIRKSGKMFYVIYRVETSYLFSLSCPFDISGISIIHLQLRVSISL